MRLSRNECKVRALVCLHAVKSLLWFVSCALRSVYEGSYGSKIGVAPSIAILNMVGMRLVSIVYRVVGLFGQKMLITSGFKLAVACVDRLKRVGFNPVDVTVANYHQSMSTYWLFHPFKPMQYCGSTKDTVLNRMSARVRAVRRNDESVVEPSVRVWAAMDNLPEFLLVPGVSSSCVPRLRADEDCLIHDLCPSLNHPFVQRLVKRYVPKQQQVFVPKRLHRRRMIWRQRRLLLKPVSRRLVSADLRRKIDVLHGLCENPRACKFQLRLCLVRQFSDIELYSLVRMAKQLPAISARSAISHLKLVFQRRRLAMPRRVVPLVCAALPCDSYRRDVVHFVRGLIDQAHANKGTLPYFIPSVRVSFSAIVTIKSLLSQWSKHMLEFDIDRDASSDCICKSGSSIATSSEFDFFGHRVWTGSEISGLSNAASRIAMSCINEAVLPTRRKFVSCFKSSVMRFFRAVNVSYAAIDDFKKQVTLFATTAYDSVVSRCGSSVFREFDVLSIARACPGVLWDCEDHKYSRLVGYCPAAVSLMIRETMEGDVFTRLRYTSVDRAVELIQSSLSRAIVKRHPWASPSRAHEDKLPSITFIGKRKKQFRKARPVIRFCGAFWAKLHRAHGRALAVITEEVLGPELSDSHFNIGRTSQVGGFVAKVRERAMQLARSGVSLDSVSIDVDSSDLAGFFTSVPHDRILSAVAVILARWWSCRLRRDPEAVWEKATVAVFASKQKSGRKVNVFVSDMYDIVKHMLKWTMFSLGSTVWQQVRGGCIGSPLAGVLCCAVVTLYEANYLSSLKISVDCAVPKMWAACRYVDNRLLAYFKQNELVHPVVPALKSLEFYRDPILLEPEPDLVFLGAQLKLSGMLLSSEAVVPGWKDDGSVSIVEVLWRYRGCHGAESMMCRFGSVFGRCALASQLSSSPVQAQRAVTRLFVVMTHVMVGDMVLRVAASRLSRLGVTMFPKSFSSRLRRAVGSLESLLALERHVTNEMFRQSLIDEIRMRRANRVNSCRLV